MKIYQQIYDYAITLYDEDLAKKIGENGLKYIIDTLTEQNFKGPFSIITILVHHHGTALGIIRSTYQALQKNNSKQDFWLDHIYPCETRPYNQGAKLTTYEFTKNNSKQDFWLDHIYPCETRPYNQGAKLTTYELDYEQIPFTLICDNMVSSLINTLSDDNKNLLRLINLPL